MNVGFACLLICATVGADDFPEQFYTNGKYVDAWNPIPREGRKESLWFSRISGEQVAYEQDLVIIYDDEPEWAYYQNQTTREFIGRFSYKTGKYSLLPLDARRASRKEIPESAFPTPAEMPQVDQLLPKSKIKSKLLAPPPTKEHPALAGSSWNSTYFTADDKPIKARVTVGQASGTYTIEDGGQVLIGELFNVRHSTPDPKVFQIVGNWRLGDRSGHFRFLVTAENLNQFQGEWGEQAKIEGIWSGTRIRATK